MAVSDFRWADVRCLDPPRTSAHHPGMVATASNDVGTRSGTVPNVSLGGAGFTWSGRMAIPIRVVAVASAGVVGKRETVISPGPPSAR